MSSAPSVRAIVIAIGRVLLLPFVAAFGVGAATIVGMVYSLVFFVMLATIVLLPTWLYFHATAAAAIAVLLSAACVISIILKTGRPTRLLEKVVAILVVFLAQTAGFGSLYWMADRLWPGHFVLADKLDADPAGTELKQIGQQLRWLGNRIILVEAIKAQAAKVVTQCGGKGGSIDLGGAGKVMTVNTRTVHFEYMPTPSGGERRVAVAEGDTMVEFTLDDEVVNTDGPGAIMGDDPLRTQGRGLLDCKDDSAIQSWCDKLLVEMWKQWAAKITIARALLERNARPSLLDFVYYSLTLSLFGQAEIEVQSVGRLGRVAIAAQPVVVFVIGILGVDGMWTARKRPKAGAKP